MTLKFRLLSNLISKFSLQKFLNNQTNSLRLSLKRLKKQKLFLILLGLATHKLFHQKVLWLVTVALNSDDLLKLCLINQLQLGAQVKMQMLVTKLSKVQVKIKERLIKIERNKTLNLTIKWIIPSLVECRHINTPYLIKLFIPSNLALVLILSQIILEICFQN